MLGVSLLLSISLAKGSSGHVRHSQEGTGQRSSLIALASVEISLRLKLSMSEEAMMHVRTPRNGLEGFGGLILFEDSVEVMSWSNRVRPKAMKSGRTSKHRIW